MAESMSIDSSVLSVVRFVDATGLAPGDVLNVYD